MPSSCTAAPRRWRCSVRPARSRSRQPPCSTSARSTPTRRRSTAAPPAPPSPPEGAPLSPGHVLAALAERLPADAILVEESPSSRPELLARIPTTRPMGFVGSANGGLGFGLSGAIGLRMGTPARPVVAVLGDGATLYAIQALWSAARYGVGLLVIVMANGGYSVMDAQARDSRRPECMAALRRGVDRDPRRGARLPGAPHQRALRADRRPRRGPPHAGRPRYPAGARRGGRAVNRLAGKSALITGGCGSIGLASARAFVAEGARVLLLDLDGEALERAVGGAGRRARRLRRRRHDRQRRRRRGRGRRRRALRLTRHRLRQRRHRRADRAADGVPGGRLRAGAARQRARAVPRRQARAARDARRRQPDHQLERGGPHLRPRHRRLRDLQARRRGADAHGRQGDGGGRHPRQHDSPGPGRQRLPDRDRGRGDRRLGGRSRRRSSSR